MVNYFEIFRHFFLGIEGWVGGVCRIQTFLDFFILFIYLKGTRAERKGLLNNNTQTRIDTQMIGPNKNAFQLELKNRFAALDDIDTLI